MQCQCELRNDELIGEGQPPIDCTESGEAIEVIDCRLIIQFFVFMNLNYLYEGYLKAELTSLLSYCMQAERKGKMYLIILKRDGFV